jgi:uncharacterized protein (TIGR02757 family)
LTKSEQPSAPDPSRLRAYLDPIVARFENPAFLDRDPVSIPHGFDDPADIEIIGLWSALLAWGRRDLMLRKLEELCERMRYRPHRFIHDFGAGDSTTRMAGFVHRTFNDGDALWLCRALSETIRAHGSLDRLCAGHMGRGDDHAGAALEALSGTLLNALPDSRLRMRKHLARPSTGSACKRLNLYLRWMVRPGPVDFGIWRSIEARQLLLPLDVHSGRQARRIGLIARKANDWRAAIELTAACRLLNPDDPARYDFAFFGAGEAGEFLTLPD